MFDSLCVVSVEAEIGLLHGMGMGISKEDGLNSLRGDGFGTLRIINHYDC